MSAKEQKYALPGEVWDSIKEANRVKVLLPNGSVECLSPINIPGDAQVILKKDGTPSLMLSTPGRKRKSDTDIPEESKAAGEVIAEMKERRKRFFKSDPLYRIARKDPDSSDFMDLILVELAKESAAMGFEIEEGQLSGKDVSKESGRRVRVLEKLGQTWLHRVERLRNVGVVDLDTVAMKTFIQCFFTDIAVVMEAMSFKPDAIKTFLDTFAKRMDSEWKIGVKKKMKKAVEENQT